MFLLRALGESFSFLLPFLASRNCCLFWLLTLDHSDFCFNHLKFSKLDSSLSFLIDIDTFDYIGSNWIIQNNRITYFQVSNIRTSLEAIIHPIILSLKENAFPMITFTQENLTHVCPQLRFCISLYKFNTLQNTTFVVTWDQF